MSKRVGLGKRAKAEALRPNLILVGLVLLLAGLAGGTFGFAVFVELYGRPSRDEIAVKISLALCAASWLSFIWTGYRVVNGLRPLDLRLPFPVSPSGLLGIPVRIFPWISGFAAQILGAVIARTIFR